MAEQSIERFISSCMKECVEDNVSALAENSAEAGKRAVKLLKQKSKVRTGAYKKGWKADVKTDETGTECTVHNRVYQLTHLLENGHAIKNQTGKYYGDVPGDGVIREVADQVAREFAEMGGRRTMIELKALCGVLDSLGIPWANQRFADGEEPAPPFICLVAGYNEAAYADNNTYLSWMPYDIALYTRHRDYATEKRIRAALEAAECPYTLGITNIDSEELTEAAFTVNVAES